MTKERMVPASWLEARDRKIEELEAQDQRWQNGVNALLREHKPYGEAEIFAVGWGTRTRDFYCERCRMTWPCRTFNDLRALYANAHEWSSGKVAYAPLKLHPIEEEEST